MGFEEPSQLFGIQELFRPKKEPAEIDIVAVHGLNGDAFKTWTAKSNNICWLNHPEFLTKYVNCARVLTWGYNANISSLKGKTTSSDRVLQHAQTLIAQLHADRDLEDANERPIIFICHSLGGIVVKRALAYSASRNSSKVAHLTSIYTSTYGLLFFGTPHSGASKARLLGSLQKLAALAAPKAAVQFESGLLNALEQESETLQNITDQFTPLMDRFRIFFFWEQEKTDMKYTKEYIVDEASAAPMISNTERCGVAADHRSMVQFDKNTLQGFRTTVSALKRYSLEAPQVIKGRWAQALQAMNNSIRHEAMIMLQGIQKRPDRNYMHASDDISAQHIGVLGRAWTVESNSSRMLDGLGRREELQNDERSQDDLRLITNKKSI